MSYAIGVAEPTSVRVDTYGTGVIEDDKMVEEIAQKVVNSKYEFDPSKEYVLLDDVVDILDSWKERCV